MRNSCAASRRPCGREKNRLSLPVDSGGESVACEENKAKPVPLCGSRTQKNMKQNSFLTQWLILGVALIYLGGAVGYNLILERERIQSGEEERLLTQARVIEENAVQNLKAINQVLVRLRKQSQQDTPGLDLNEYLKILVDAMPGVRTVAILDGKGNIRASNQPGIIGSNFSQRDYFKEPRQHPDEGMLYVSPPFRTVL